MNWTIKMIMLFLVASLKGFAQNGDLDTLFEIEKRGYSVYLEQNKEKSQNDTTFFMLYNRKSQALIGREIHSVVNNSTGDTLTSGTYQISKNEILFHRFSKNSAPVENEYIANGQGSLSLLSEHIQMVTEEENKNGYNREPVPARPEKNPEDAEIIESYPEYPGGMNAVAQFLSKHLVYPDLAIENEVSGRVMVSFVVDMDGSVSDIRIDKGVGFGCDEEVVRVLKKMTNWIPAYKKGKPVRSRVTLPVSFQLAE